MTKTYTQEVIFEGPDRNGDVYSEDCIRKAVEGFNKSDMRWPLFPAARVNPDKFTPTTKSILEEFENDKSLIRGLHVEPLPIVKLNTLVNAEYIQVFFTKSKKKRRIKKARNLKRSWKWIFPRTRISIEAMPSMGWGMPARPAMILLSKPLYDEFIAEVGKQDQTNRAEAKAAGELFHDSLRMFQ